MHLHLIEPVLEGVGDAHRGVRQLALLADRHESRLHLMRNRAAEYETPRLDAGDAVDVLVAPGTDQLLHHAVEDLRIAEERGDVAEHHPGPGVVPDSANRIADLALRVGVHGRQSTPCGATRACGCWRASRGSPSTAGPARGRGRRAP